MPPKGYKTISLKALTADRLAVRAAESGVELSVYVNALLVFSQKDHSPIDKWSDFLIWYDAERPEEVGK